jgi:hypothetical protein
MYNNIKLLFRYEFVPFDERWPKIKCTRIESFTYFIAFTPSNRVAQYAHASVSSFV